MDLVTAGTTLYIGKKLLGKTFDIVSDDIAKLYEKGRDKIIEKANKKINDIDENKSTNLRVTRDVFWNGSFTDEEICAEYFGGVLASSRSKDGKNDDGVYYINLIKSLSSNQLKLHYLIYQSLNKLLISDPQKSKLNVADENYLSKESIFFFLYEIEKITKIVDVGAELNSIYFKGLLKSLIINYYDGHFDLKKVQPIPYVQVVPTSLGIQLYAVAHNKQKEWRNFSVTDFGEFESFTHPTIYGKKLQDILDAVGIKKINFTE